MYHQSSNDLNEILLKVSQGDEQAFAILFKTYHAPLNEYLSRITESEELTQEIALDVFMKLWANRAALTEVSHFKSYLLTVAKNHAFNCLKKLSREKKKEKSWVEEVLKLASNPAEETNSVDYSSLIDAAVALLPPQQKKVYTLSRINKMKQEEIAVELNIALETVKKHMVLALKFIKNNITQFSCLFISVVGMFTERFFS